MKRSLVEDKYKWNTKDLFKDEKEWENLYSSVEKQLDFSEFKGKLGDKDRFLSCLKKEDEISRKIEKLYVYAMMLHDADTADSHAGELLSRAESLSVAFSSSLSFVTPELTALPKEVLEGYILDKDFADYDYTLKRILENKQHVLGEEAENILALGGEVFSGFKEIFTKIDNADFPIKTVKDSDGDKYSLTHGTYSVALQSPDRNLRRKAFKAYYSSYIGLINTISTTYYNNVKKNVFLTKARKYKSCLDRALSNEDVSSTVYLNLIESVNSSLPLLHKYIEEKRIALKLDKMHMYDIYVPTVEDASMQLEYEDAYNLVVEGLKPLGEEYSKLLKQAKEERWLDVYETEGKRSGAYSVAVYDCHPYVLLNYQKTTHDVFTIAHEMGHSIHSYYSNKTQNYAKADYKIFVAEVASTVNEVLLLKHVLKTATDKKLKKYLLSYFLEMIRTTLFRQTQFAEFEYFAHSKVEKGEPLTKENMCKEYLKLNKKYYGKSIVSDKEISYEWARIPHFYSAFYVYKYATGITAAIAIADRILNEGEVAVKDYFSFLSSGSSDSPVNLLKKAGVDLTKKEVFNNAMKVFEDILNEYTALNR